MKNIEFIEQELELLKTIIATAVTNGNRSTPLAFVPSPAEYLIVCDICNKVFDKN